MRRRGGPLGKLRDLGDSIVQVDFDTDSIALGDLVLVQQVGIADRQGPGVSFFRLESDRPFDLIQAEDDASGKGGFGFADKDGTPNHAEQTNGHDCDLEGFHHDTSLVRLWVRDNHDNRGAMGCPIPLPLRLFSSSWLVPGQSALPDMRKYLHIIFRVARH